MKRLSKALIWLGKFFFTLYFRINPDKAKSIPGIPYQRDPDAPCDGYEPFIKHSNNIFSGCETDGHYLCQKCCHRKIEME